jgi:uncharacterized protein (TIGR03437 family)
MKVLVSLVLASQAAFCADYLTGQAARLVIGQQTFTAALSQPPVFGNEGVLGGVGGVAFGANSLFVADGNPSGSSPLNNRVLIYTPVSGLPTPYNVPSPQSSSFSATCPVCIGHPNLVLGQPDLDTAAQNLTQNGFYNATAVATDGTVLAVADSNNNRVLIWNKIPTSNDQNADVVVGQTDFTHGASLGTPTSTSLRGPQGVWIANGKLYIADTLNDRVLIYNSIPTANGAAADIVVGAPDFTTLIAPPVTEDTVPPTQTNLSSPTSVTTDATHLYVTDLGHNRVLIWNVIPTANNAPASVVIGQPDFVSQTGNNSSVLCPSNGTDTTVTPNVPTYPLLCGTTLSFPRFTLSDGTRLYVADGGNDRVLVYNTIPTVNTAKADVILGQVDENSDDPTADSDSMAQPSSLAWDGTNLYVADTYNLRVLVYTPMGSGLPITGVRNAASLEIYATGTVTFTGTPVAKDTVTITIGTTAYTYTVVTNDTLASVVTGLANLINGTTAGSTKDPNVIAAADTVNPTVVLTARVPGTAGEGTALASTVSSTSTILPALPGGSTININLASAVKIAPGTLITIFGTGLSDQTQAFDFSTSTVPVTLGGTKAYVDGLQIPLLFVSPDQINAQMPFETQNRSSVSVYVVNTHADGSQTATNAIGTSIVPENPGLFALGGIDPRPGIVNHLSQYASGLVSIDGTITAGNTVTVTVNANSYTYTVVATDTLTTVRDNLTALIANDPAVTATPTNIYTRIYLQARVPGTAGNAITFTATTSNSATVTATALGDSGALCCGNSPIGPVTTANPAQAGEVLYTYATGLGVTSPGTDSITGQIAPSAVNPLLTPVDSILVGGVTANVVQASLVPGYAGLYQVAFQIGSGLPTDPETQLTIAQQDFVSNIVTFPVVVAP